MNSVIIRPSVHKKTPAMLETSGGVVKPERRLDVFILTPKKKCVRCGVVKSASEFNANKKNKDGLKSWCKSCFAEHRREWAKKNPDKVYEFRKTDYARHSDNYKLRAKEWRKLNPQRAKDADALWRENNKERKSEIDRLWRQSPEGQASRFVGHTKRRLLKKNQGNGITKNQYKQVVSDPCVYCGRTKKIELDHIVPIVAGGADDVSNAAPVCRSCNSSKGKKSLLVFLFDVLNGHKN